MIRIFAPPVLDDLELTRKAHLLHWLLLVGMALETVMLGVFCVVLPQNLTRWLGQMLVVDAVGMGCVVLNKRGYTRSATWLLLGVLFALGIAVCWTGGGIRSPMVQIFAIIVFVAGLMLDWRSGIGAGVVSLLAALGLVWAEYAGVLPSGLVIHTPFSLWWNLAAFLAMLIVLQSLAIRGIGQALVAARQELAKRQQVEQALRDSEAFRQRVFEASRVPIVVMDAASWRYVDCNRAAVEIYGFATREETLGKTPTEVSAPTQFDGRSSSEKARDYINQALKEGDVLFEWRHQRPTGEVWDAEVHLMSFKSGERQLLQFTLQDITEWKKAEEALRTSERRFRTLVEASPMPIMFSSEGRIGYTNRSFRQLIQAGDNANLEGESLMTVVAPEFRETVASHVRARQSGQPAPTHYELVALRRDGTRFPCEVYVAVIELPGGPVTLAHVQDVTERRSAEHALRESEAKFRTLFETAGEAIFLMRKDRFVDCNPRTLEMFGCEARDQIVGHPPYEFSPPKQSNGRDSRECAMEKISAALAGQPQSFEWLHTKRDGTAFAAEVNLNRVEVSGQMMLQAIVRDITERKRTELIIQRLSQLGRGLCAVTDAAAVAKAVATVADELLSWDACFVKLRSQDMTRAWYLLNEDTINGKRQTVGRAVGDEITSIEQRVMETGPQLVLRTGPDGEAGFVRFGDSNRPSQSLLYVPLRHQGRYLGMFSIQSYKSQAYTSASLDLLQTLADHVAGALERIRTEAALGASQQRFRDLFERSPDAVFVEDTCGTVLDANPAACRLHGMSRKELVGKNVLETVPLEARASVAAELPNWMTGKITQAERTFLTVDGRVVPVEIRGAPIQYGDQPALLLHVRDITERKEAEARIRQQAALLEASHDAILVWDMAAGIQYMNPAAEALTGKQFAETKSLELAAVLRPKSVLALEAAIQDVRSRGDWSGELDLLTSDDKSRNVASRWTALADSEGNVSSVLISCNDITEQKRLESQYLRAQRLESVGTLASGVAHDLNNILSPILMGIELLGLEATDEDTRSVLAMMKDSARRGVDTVKQLLTFARGTDAQKGPVQLRHLLKEIARLLQQTFPKNIQIYTDYAGQPATVLADPSQLHQVLMNLCVNARDAMPDGGVLFVKLENQTLDEASAEIHPKARPGSYVVFRVSDSGTGIPPEILDRIFDPFFTTKPQGKGTGLGLATVIGIVESHGGFVLVDSKLGQGTTFQVYLPASVAADKRREGKQAVAAPRGQGELVLVVDDEVAILRLAGEVLRHGGYAVLSASSASEAIQLYQKHHDSLRLVLTDIMMPFGDGRQLITILYEQDPKLPIVAMSGLATTEFQRETLKRGACAFIRKPFAAEELLRALANALGKKAS